jgi:thioredoxin-like negative regulator of GroEL
VKELEEELAKMTRGHNEAVQEAVTVRMAMRKNEEQLSAKMAEAAAEANKAAEASRLLESLRRDFNESSLKGAFPFRALRDRST